MRQFRNWISRLGLTPDSAMRRMSQYPTSVSEVLDRSMRFNPVALAAVREFARSKPWRGTLVERWQKFQSFNSTLARAYSVQTPFLVLGGQGSGDSTSSSYRSNPPTIWMRGRLSVTTFLHEWGHHLYGPSETMACRWSVNLFRRCFPRSFARCRFDGHLLRSGG